MGSEAVQAVRVAARDWLPVCQLPVCARTEPVELVWPRLKRLLANLAKRNLSQLTALAKTQLKECSTGPAFSTGSSQAPA